MVVTLLIALLPPLLGAAFMARASAMATASWTRARRCHCSAPSSQGLLNLKARKPVALEQKQLSERNLLTWTPRMFGTLMMFTL